MVVKPVTPTNLAAISTDFNVIFNSAYESASPMYDRVAMTIPSRGDRSVYAWLDAIPGFREWIGDRHIHDLEGLGYEIINKLFEMTVGLKRTDIEDDLVGQYNVRVQLMGNNAAIFPDTLVYPLFNAGFTSTCYDGQPFYGTHTWKGSSYTNATNAALDADTFNTAIETLMLIVGSIGTNGEAPLIPNPQFQLVVGPKLRAKANEITKAEYNNFGATNINLNAAELLVTPYISDAKWYVNITNSPIKPLIWQPRTEVEITDQIAPTDFQVFMRDVYMYGARRRGGAGYGLWQLSYGSTGGN